jgi:hypothetical protein
VGGVQEKLSAGPPFDEMQETVCDVMAEPPADALPIVTFNKALAAAVSDAVTLEGAVGGPNVENDVLAAPLLLPRLFCAVAVHTYAFEKLSELTVKGEFAPVAVRVVPPLDEAQDTV